MATVSGNRRHPDVRVVGHDPERLPLATAADHHRHLVLQRERGQRRWSKADRPVPSLALRRRPGGSDRRHGLADSRVAGQTGAEVEPEGLVLELEPRAAAAQHGAAAADVVDRDHRFATSAGCGTCSHRREAQALPFGGLRKRSKGRDPSKIGCAVTKIA